jgi:hypothetical protein
LQNGLVGYWPFCGNANDESGNGNDGTVNGATLTEDRLGNANEAYSFDGVDDFIEVANNQLLTITGDLTMAAWVNSNGSNGSNYQTIICKGASYWTWEYLMTLSYHTGIIHDTKFLTARALGMGNQEQTWSQTPYQPTAWEFWVATYANGLASIYKNGVLYTTESFSLVPEPQNSPLLFGKNTLSDNSVQYFGKIDDIGIWNRALTPEEVQQLYTGDVTSVNKASSQPTIAIFPNPTQGQITIDFGSDASLTAHRVFVQTIQGQQAYSANIVEKTTTMNLSEVCGKGLYFVHIIDEQGNTKDIRKIVLQ